MPTNLMKPLKRPGARRQPATKPTQIELLAGPVILTLTLLETPTAARILAALPLFAAAEPWGSVLHFKLPIGSGRERGARINARLGEVYYWHEESRVILPYGPTPISGAGEIRLPRPCNAWAMVAGDVAILKRVVPSAKVTLRRTGSSH